MKKSKYIGKYDYIGYYTKQKEMWFFSNAEILAGLRTRIMNEYTDDDSDDQSESEDEFDVLDFYKEELENNKNVDENDPRIIEGIIIDKKTKEFIKDKYKNYKCYDFDSEEYKYMNMEYLYKETIGIINSNENVIIFQPVFINDKLITKCDALVKTDTFIKIIETKATSSSKLHHYLDIFFQKKVIEAQSFSFKYNFQYELCLIKYEFLEKYNVSFETTPYFNITKTAPSLDRKKIELYDNYHDVIKAKSFLKLGKWFVQPHFDEIYPISFTNVLNNNYDEFYERESISKATKATSKINIFIDLHNNFDNAINELWCHKQLMSDKDSIPLNFKPSIQDNNEFKKSQFWNELKEIYINQGYEIFKYSGNVVNQSKNALIEIEKNNKKELAIEDIKGSPEKKILYERCFIDKKNIIDNANCKNLLNKKKRQSVYFDFETINTSIRSFDNTLPFSQIITQCSVIKSNDNEISDWVCNNLIIDPKTINKEWFMKIVDSIYEGSNASYVVYNKNFEKSRLEELKDYINDINYTNKINIINANLYDLADFFNPSKNNIILESLHGFYSIKKVLSLIEEENPNIFKLCKCKDYKKLEIKNGAICQQETTKRFFSIINDEDWLHLEKDLKVYCENDVRAMIAVELYIKDLIEKS